MKRSVFSLLDHYPEAGESLSAVQDAALLQADAADDLGFSSIWIAEHHFQSFGTVPNPAVFLAAVAQRTRRIRLGPAVCVLPLRNPILVAEDYALVDMLSKGRLNMGVGAGAQPFEFRPFGIDFEARKAHFRHHLSIIRQRWEAAVVGETGPNSLNVAPVQRPSPPIYVATMDKAMAFQIGCTGDSMLTLIPPIAGSIQDAMDRVAAHAQGGKEAGDGGDSAESVVVLFAHVAETEADAAHHAVPALARLSRAMQWQEGMNDPAAIYEQSRRTGVGLFGRPSDIEEQIARLADAGVGHIAFVTQFGGMPKGISEQSLRMLAEVSS